MNRLNPRFPRMAVPVSLGFWGTSVFAYFWQGHFENRWWTADYFVTMCIPFLLVLVTIWFGFVPRRLEYDEEGVLIETWWKGSHAYSWNELRYHGGSSNMFLLQFGSEQAIQIFGQAYPKPDWKRFREFLKERYPEREASGWIGPFGFRRRK